METSLLTADEVAEVLRCSRRFVYRLMERSDFPKLKIGRKYLVPTDELDRWVHANSAAEAAEKD